MMFATVHHKVITKIDENDLVFPQASLQNIETITNLGSWKLYRDDLLR